MSKSQICYQEITTVLRGKWNYLTHLSFIVIHRSQDRLEIKFPFFRLLLFLLFLTEYAYCN